MPFWQICPLSAPPEQHPWTGVAVAVGVGVTVNVGVTVTVGVGVAVLVGVGVAVTVTVGVAVTVGVGVGVRVAVGVGVGVATLSTQCTAHSTSPVLDVFPPARTATRLISSFWLAFNDAPVKEHVWVFVVVSIWHSVAVSVVVPAPKLAIFRRKTSHVPVAGVVPIEITPLHAPRLYGASAPVPDVFPAPPVRA